MRPDTGLPLDLSFATTTAPACRRFHCQYMQNMGVFVGPMRITLMKGDKLWGLISCGNREPLQVLNYLRHGPAQTIGQVLALQIMPWRP